MERKRPTVAVRSPGGVSLASTSHSVASDLVAGDLTTDEVTLLTGAFLRYHAKFQTYHLESVEALQYVFGELGLTGLIPLPELEEEFHRRAGQKGFVVLDDVLEIFRILKEHSLMFPSNDTDEDLLRAMRNDPEARDRCKAVGVDPMLLAEGGESATELVLSPGGTTLVQRSSLSFSILDIAAQRRLTRARRRTRRFRSEATNADPGDLTHTETQALSTAFDTMVDPTLLAKVSRSIVSSGATSVLAGSLHSQVLLMRRLRKHRIRPVPVPLPLPGFYADRKKQPSTASPSATRRRTSLGAQRALSPALVPLPHSSPKPSTPTLPFIATHEPTLDEYSFLRPLRCTVSALLAECTSNPRSDDGRDGDGDSRPTRMSSAPLPPHSLLTLLKDAQEGDSPVADVRSINATRTVSAIVDADLKVHHPKRRAAPVALSRLLTAIAHEAEGQWKYVEEADRRIAQRKTSPYLRRR